MKPMFCLTLMCGLLQASTLAHAQWTPTPVSLDSSWQTTIVRTFEGTYPAPMRLNSDARLAFSADNSFLTMLDAVGATIESGAGANLVTTTQHRPTYEKLTSLSLALPISRVDAEVQPDGAFRPQVISSSGSLTVRTTDDGLTTTGGWITFSNFTMDLPHRTMRVDIEGANGVGTVAGVSLLADVGDAQSFLAKNPYLSLACAPLNSPVFCNLDYLPPQHDFLSMHPQQAMLPILARSLGLMPVGEVALESATEWGTWTTTAVPEPATIVQWGLGLAGMAALSARRKRRPHTARALA
jgi:MYXO-CTERM domain-containing protein